MQIVIMSTRSYSTEDQQIVMNKRMSHYDFMKNRKWKKVEKFWFSKRIESKELEYVDDVIPFCTAQAFCPDVPVEIFVEVALEIFQQLRFAIPG